MSAGRTWVLVEWADGFKDRGWLIEQDGDWVQIETCMGGISSGKAKRVERTGIVTPEAAE